jgi:hypothetical protein
MTNETRSGLKVPAERPDKKAAARDPKGNALDRPGFDLGGAVDDNEDQSQLPPRGRRLRLDRNRPLRRSQRSERHALPRQRGRRARLGLRDRRDEGLRRQAVREANAMTQKSKESGRETPDANLDELSIDKPRLTPQGRTDPSGHGEDRRSPAAA